MSEEPLPASLYAEAEDVNTPGERLNILANHDALQRLVAANPATPERTLKRLSTSHDVAVRRAVASNPNTALSDLRTLVFEFPLEFLRNPVIPLLNLTQPDFFQKLSPLAWASLLRFTDISPVWFRQLKNGGSFLPPDTRALLQLHVSQAFASPQTEIAEPGDVRREYRKRLPMAFSLTTDEDIELFILFVLLFPYTAPMLRAHWVAVARADPRRADIVLTSLRKAGVGTLARLAQEKDGILLQLVACHPATPPRLLKHLAIYRSSQNIAGSRSVWKAVAGNPRTPQEAMYRLISSPATSLRRQAVTHPSLEMLDLEIMALDEEPSVRAALATTHRLSDELYAQLARDPAPSVRAALARNVKTPLALLNELARAAEIAVRVAVAGNPRLPEDAQGVLLADPSETVRAALAGNAHLRADYAAVLVHDAAPRVRAALAANPRTPLSLLTALLRAEEPEVWAGLAHHPQLPPELLAQLARQGDTRTRLAVAAHSRTPAETLAQLAQENTHAIWLALTGNPGTPLNVLEMALPTASAEMLCRLVQHPAMRRAKCRPLLTRLAARLQELIAANRLPAWLRQAFLQYTNALPAEIVACFAASPYWQERYLVARRPHLPEELLTVLANDGICHVQTAARQALERRQPTQDKRSVDNLNPSEL